jgi:hypothetical protein
VDADGEKSGDAEVIDVDFELVRPHRPAAFCSYPVDHYVDPQHLSI